MNEQFTNTLYYGDNLEILRSLSKDKNFFLQTNGGIDLIYIDPPFNSNRKYNMLFEDMLREVSDKERYKAQKEAFNDT
jgi:16S rRNA G966 N2-methylase RsmD